MGEEPVGGEELERGRKEKANRHDAKARKHLHGSRPFNQEEHAIDDERNDADIQQIDESNARLQIDEKVFHLVLKTPLFAT